MWNQRLSFHVFMEAAAGELQIGKDVCKLLVDATFQKQANDCAIEHPFVGLLSLRATSRYLGRSCDMRY